MFSVGVRDHIMIAHSLKGETFGPAQQVHGCTYTVDVEFRRSELNSDGIVIDIALATQLLKQILQKFNYRNLDSMPEFANHNSTTEYVAKTIFDHFQKKLNSQGIESIKVTLHESHIAWASYERDL